jgi:hypothetical protein
MLYLKSHMHKCKISEYNLIKMCINIWHTVMKLWKNYWAALLHHYYHDIYRYRYKHALTHVNVENGLWNNGSFGEVILKHDVIITQGTRSYSLCKLNQPNADYFIRLTWSISSKCCCNIEYVVAAYTKQWSSPDDFKRFFWEDKGGGVYFSEICWPTLWAVHYATFKLIKSIPS